MQYAYTAKNQKGEAYSSEMTVADKSELYARVRGEGGRLLSVREKISHGHHLIFGNLFGKVNAHDKIALAKNLGSMLSAGLSVTRSFEVMEKQARKRSLRDLLRDLTKSVSGGQPLSEALKKHPDVFPPLFASMVRAGEESGNLPESLRIIALEMDKSYTLTKRVRGALIYPAVILALMLIISVLMLIYMVPALTVTFEGFDLELPLTTRIIIGASGFLVENTLLTLSALTLLLLGIPALAKTKSGRRSIESLLIRLPVVGDIVREISSARTARTLSSLLSAGVPIVNALEVTEEVLTNHVYKQALREARDAVERGETVSAVLSRYEAIYPPFMSEMAAVGEETGKISEMLRNAAEYYENDIDDKTKNLSTVIEPALMIVIGVGVGIFALSMLAPTYSLIENI